MFLLRLVTCAILNCMFMSRLIFLKLAIKLLLVHILMEEVSVVEVKDDTMQGKGIKECLIGPTQ